MIVSHSRIECFESCPFKYKLRYIDEIDTIKADNADNALFLGTVLHTGIEKGVQDAISEYYAQYPIITDEHINEAIKLEVMIPKAVKMLPKGFFEVELLDDDFKGYIDLLAPVEVELHGNTEICDECPNCCDSAYSGHCPCGKFTTLSDDVYDIYDFKYSNNVDKYSDSVQIHLYKYFFEKLNPGKKIRHLYYLCVPKVQIKQKKTEDLQQFRTRILEELEDAEPQLVPIEYDLKKVVEWLFKVKHTIEAEEFPKKTSYLCRFCDYQNYCERNETFMLLPKNERRNIESIDKKVLWIYGQPFSGKTTFANHFPDPLMLNTDGNIKFVDAPYISIKDKIEVTGRMTSKTLAWVNFKEVIEELEKKQNDFKTIVVDLLEDLYEYCRLYMYDQMGITHESDDSFRAWDKVRTEFLSTLKRLMSLDYENIILISHEDTTKDVTKKGGDKLTSIKPNLQDKVALKVAGMVDIVARVVADGDSRMLSFKTNEVIFGGGRLKTKTNEIDLEYNKFLEVYNEANKGVSARIATTPTESIPEPENTVTEAEKAMYKVTHSEPTEEAPFDTSETTEEAPAPTTRTRRRRN